MPKQYKRTKLFRQASLQNSHNKPFKKQASNQEPQTVSSALLGTSLVSLQTQRAAEAIQGFSSLLGRLGTVQHLSLNKQEHPAFQGYRPPTTKDLDFLMLYGGRPTIQEQLSEQLPGSSGPTDQEHGTTGHQSSTDAVDPIQAALEQLQKDTEYMKQKLKAS